MRWLVTFMVALLGCDATAETVGEASMAIRKGLMRGGVTRPRGFSTGRDLDAGRIMLMGDSLTKGNHTPSKDGWRRSFHIGLITAGVRHSLVGGIEGDGNGGGTLVYPDNRHEGYGSNSISDLTARVHTRFGINPADIVVGHLGTVDAAAGATAANMLVDLGLWIDAVHAEGAPRIVLQQILPQGPPSGGDNQIVIDYNAGMPALVATKRAAGVKIVLVDQYTGVTIGDVSTDGVHVTVEWQADIMGARNVQGVIAVLGL